MLAEDVRFLSERSRILCLPVQPESRAALLHWLSLFPKSHCGNAEWPRWMLHSVGLRNPKLRKPQSLIMDCKPTYPIFVLEGDNYLYCTKKPTNLLSTLDRDTISVYQAAHYTNILEKVAGTKFAGTSVLKKC